MYLDQVPIHAIGVHLASLIQIIHRWIQLASLIPRGCTPIAWIGTYLIWSRYTTLGMRLATYVGMCNINTSALMCVFCTIKRQIRGQKLEMVVLASPAEVFQWVYIYWAQENFNDINQDGTLAKCNALLIMGVTCSRHNCHVLYTVVAIVYVHPAIVQNTK